LAAAAAAVPVLKPWRSFPLLLPQGPQGAWLQFILGFFSALAVSFSTLREVWISFTHPHNG
jgi:hypothetical protein